MPATFIGYYCNFVTEKIASLIVCNCVVPSCYLIFEILIGVHYDYLFVLSEIDCS